MKISDAVRLAKTACFRCRSTASVILEIERELQEGRIQQAKQLQSRLYASRAVSESDKKIIDDFIWWYSELENTSDEEPSA